MGFLEAIGNFIKSENKDPKLPSHAIDNNQQTYRYADEKDLLDNLKRHEQSLVSSSNQENSLYYGNGYNKNNTSLNYQKNDDNESEKRKLLASSSKSTLSPVDNIRKNNLITNFTTDSENRVFENNNNKNDEQDEKSKKENKKGTNTVRKGSPTPSILLYKIGTTELRAITKYELRDGSWTALNSRQFKFVNGGVGLCAVQYAYRDKSRDDIYYGVVLIQPDGAKEDNFIKREPIFSFSDRTYTSRNLDLCFFCVNSRTIFDYTKQITDSEIEINQLQRSNINYVKSKNIEDLKQHSIDQFDIHNKMTGTAQKIFDQYIEAHEANKKMAWARAHPDTYTYYIYENPAFEAYYERYMMNKEKIRNYYKKNNNNNVSNGNEDERFHSSNYGYNKMYDQDSSQYTYKERDNNKFQMQDNEKFQNLSSYQSSSNSDVKKNYDPYQQYMLRDPNMYQGNHDEGFNRVEPFNQQNLYCNNNDNNNPNSINNYSCMNISSQLYDKNSNNNADYHNDPEMNHNSKRKIFNKNLKISENLNSEIDPSGIYKYYLNSNKNEIENFKNNNHNGEDIKNLNDMDHRKNYVHLKNKTNDGINNNNQINKNKQNDNNLKKKSHNVPFKKNSYNFNDNGNNKKQNENVNMISNPNNNYYKLNKNTNNELKKNQNNNSVNYPNVLENDHHNNNNSNIMDNPNVIYNNENTSNFIENPNVLTNDENKQKNNKDLKLSLEKNKNFNDQVNENNSSRYLSQQQQQQQRSINYSDYVRSQPIPKQYQYFSGNSNYMMIGNNKINNSYRNVKEVCMAISANYLSRKDVSFVEKFHVLDQGYPGQKNYNILKDLITILEMEVNGLRVKIGMQELSIKYTLDHYINGQLNSKMLSNAGFSLNREIVSKLFFGCENENDFHNKKIKFLSVLREMLLISNQKYHGMKKTNNESINNISPHLFQNNNLSHVVNRTQNNINKNLNNKMNINQEDIMKVNQYNKEVNDLFYSLNDISEYIYKVPYYCYKSWSQIVDIKKYKTVQFAYEILSCQCPSVINDIENVKMMDSTR
jgi:hypothetical protein